MPLTSRAVENGCVLAAAEQLLDYCAFLKSPYIPLIPHVPASAANGKTKQRNPVRSVYIATAATTAANPINPPATPLLSAAPVKLATFVVVGFIDVLFTVAFPAEYGGVVIPGLMVAVTTTSLTLVRVVVVMTVAP